MLQKAMHSIYDLHYLILFYERFYKLHIVIIAKRVTEKFYYFNFIFIRTAYASLVK